VPFDHTPESFVRQAFGHSAFRKNLTAAGWPKAVLAIVRFRNEDPVLPVRDSAPLATYLEMIRPADQKATGEVSDRPDTQKTAKLAYRSAAPASSAAREHRIARHGARLQLPGRLALAPGFRHML
jgi:hypothetical protein